MQATGKKPGPKGPHGKVLVHRGTFRERLWKSMRIRRRFTIGELVADAQTGCERNAYNNAGRYVLYLVNSGYVRELPNRKPGTAPSSNGFKVFQLMKDTGPRAPVWSQARGTLHDVNTGEDAPCLPK